MTIMFGAGVALGPGVQVLGPPPFYLWAWGSNSVGQLGLGDTVNRSSPVQVGALGTWSEISKTNQSYSTFTVKTDGTLWVWGRGGEGQLGTGDAIPRSSPVQVGALTTWAGTTTSAFSYSVSTNLLRSDGTAWICGTVSYRFNYGAVTNRSSPVQVGADKNWSMIGSGGQGSWFGITTAGALWSSCAFNTGGMGGRNNTAGTSSPAQVGALTNWAGVYPGDSGVIARKTDGTLWSWGKAYPANPTAFMGQNDAVYRSSPVQIGALTNWAKVTTFKYGVQAIKTDGTMWAWGINTGGESGLGDAVNRSSPVQVGALTTWTTTGKNFMPGGAIRDDGTLWSWNGGQGSLGNNTNGFNSSPIQIGTLTTWTVMGAARQAKLAIASHAT